MPTVTLPKNFNQKIGADYMVHIMKPITKAITEEGKTTPITFKAPDVAADYHLFDYTQQPLREIPTHVRMMSHGPLGPAEFYAQVYADARIYPDEVAGIYFFIKV